MSDTRVTDQTATDETNVTDQADGTEGTTSTDETNPTEGDNPEGDGDGDEGNDDEDGDESDESKGQDVKSLPEWAQKRLTKANGEAARYRTQLREAEKLLADAKPEELQAAVEQFKTKTAELESQLSRERAARKYELPDELAARIQGNTPEEMLADAKKLSELLGTTKAPENLGGGLDPSESNEEFDPVKAAREARTRRY